ncbi:MAG: cytochrome c subunit A [Nitrospirae bacterium]|nr:MAG: cytochrome c subunit A [Nitrospirota bacterium]
MTDNQGVSRRGVLSGIGALGLGAIVLQTGGTYTDAEAKAVRMEKWPWPYVKLDPAKTAEIAYNEWYRVYCGAAVISSIFGQLRQKVGEPYKSFPIDAFIFLEGGVSGWGTICGSNLGANIVSNLIIGPRTGESEDGMLMGSEILQWYSDAQLPTFKPKNPKFAGEIPTTISNSPLCHISVGRWMKASGKELKSPERRHRCACVTGSVAYHLVELLNEWKDKKYDTKGEIPAAAFGIQTQMNCGDCHGGNIPSPPQAKVVK